MRVFVGLFLVATTAICEKKLIKADEPYGPIKDSLVHDMRRFENWTIDWSSRLYPELDGVKIPRCHEQRIRKTFNTLTNNLIRWYDAYMTKLLMNPGHLIYPVVLTISNGTDNRRLFTVITYKLYEKEVDDITDGKIKEMVIEYARNAFHLAHVSEETWKRVWNQWNEGFLAEDDYCMGGTDFDHLVSKIEKDEDKESSQNLVKQHYTDITSDTCEREACACPLHQQETLTLGFPTEEGIDQLLKYWGEVPASKLAPYSNLPETERVRRYVLDQARISSDSRMYLVARDCYEKNDDCSSNNALSNFGADLISRVVVRNFWNATYKCIFDAPYC